MSDVDLTGLSDASDREGLYKEYSGHIKERHYSSLPRLGSISQRRFPLIMLSVFGLEISKHRLPIWVPPYRIIQRKKLISKFHCYLIF
jgi:hypothetical protein